MLGEASSRFALALEPRPPVRSIIFGLLHYFFASETSILVAIRFAPSSR